MPLILLLALFQTSTPVIQAVKPNTPFFIEWTQPRAVFSEPQFRWVCNGTIVKNFRTDEAIPQAPADEAGTLVYRAQVPGLPMGLHTCRVHAVNVLGETPGEDSPIPIGEVPGKPGKVTIIQITVVSGGGETP